MSVWKAFSGSQMCSVLRVVELGLPSGYSNSLSAFSILLSSPLSHHCCSHWRLMWAIQVVLDNSSMHWATQFSSSLLIGLENEPFLVHPLSAKETQSLAVAILFLGCLFFAHHCFSQFLFQFCACSPSLCGTALFAARCGTLLSPSFSLVIRISIPANFYSFVLEKCQVSS